MLDPVALRIRELIDRKGLSNAEFANMVELSPSIVSHILNGRNKVSIQVLEKIRSHFTDVSTDYLLLGLGDLIRTKEKNQLAQSHPPTLPKHEVKTTTGKQASNSHNDLPETLEIPGDGVFHASIPGSTPLLGSQKKEALENTALLSDANKSKKKENKTDDNRIEESHNQYSTPNTTKEIVKIVMFYSDNSFEVFNSN